MRTCAPLLFLLLATALTACTNDAGTHSGGDGTSRDLGAADGSGDTPDAPLPVDMDTLTDADDGSGADGMASTDMSDMPEGARCPIDAPTEEGVIPTTAGAVAGVRDGASWSFRGIPFAAPPTGARRWTPPQPPECIDSQPLSADAFGPKCPQLERGNVIGEEDCLTLNVWTPQGYTPEDQRPVVVFIHGGGNIIGSASQSILPNGDAKIYNGQYFAENQDVVLVTIQYRLGPLGYLALDALSAESAQDSSGTYGHLDHIAALEWVQDNIAAFGGDPDNVMIFGESAGAVNVCTLVASPLAAGLFDRALMQSGACPSQPLATAEAQGAAAVATIEACADVSGADLTECLRGLDAATLIEAMPSSVGFSLAPESEGESIVFGPVVDGVLLTQSPYDVLANGEHNAVDFVVGSNSEEYDTDTLLFVDPQSEQQYRQIIRTATAPLGQGASDRVLAAYPPGDYDTPRDALVQVLTDASFTCPARRVARLAASNQTPPVYRYFFTKRTPTRQGTTPAAHGIELLYVFTTLNDIPLFQPPADVTALAEQMMARWAGLASSGVPDTTLDPTMWQPYDPARDNTLEFGDTVAMFEGVRSGKCDLWDDLLRR